jgi:hypothetical protein
MLIMQIGPIDKSKLAKTDDEFQELVKSDVDWIARSADDVSQLREAQYGPFGKLPEDDFREFVDSLVFDRGGVVTGSYKPLMGSLSLTELFEVFECFGMSQELFSSGKESKSVNRGTENARCEPAVFRFCTISCVPI